MPRTPDITGRRFGRLVAIERAPNIEKSGYSHVAWKCICDCGNEVTVMVHSLVHGGTKSCGCLQKERVKQALSKSNRRCRLYRIWQGMKNRCTNPNGADWGNYGGRGIEVCPEWMNYENFYNWAISNGYQDSLSIDRVDNNGNYCPQNCRWATAKQQRANQRSMNPRYS